MFILLLLSGERNFGVRLNKPYTSRIQIDVPVFNGTHADLLIIVNSFFFKFTFRNKESFNIWWRLVLKTDLLVFLLGTAIVNYSILYKNIINIL